MSLSLQHRKWWEVGKREVLWEDVGNFTQGKRKQKDKSGKKEQLKEEKL